MAARLAGRDRAPQARDALDGQAATSARCPRNQPTPRKPNGLVVYAEMLPARNASAYAQELGKIHARTESASPLGDRRDHYSEAPTFQPRITVGLFYIVAFFFLYCMALVAPELWAITEPASPEQEEALKKAAEEVVRLALRPRLPIALAAAVVTTGLGAKMGLLPGMRRS